MKKTKSARRKIKKEDCEEKEECDEETRKRGL